jgi:ribosomal protein S18 acetylase RimI-like enzyme
MKITVGIPHKHREEAAALYWEAFGEKLHFVLGPKYRAIRFITSVLRADHGVCAHDENGRLVGVAGFKTSQGALVSGAFQDLRRVYGWTGAAVRVALLAALESDVENERFLMDGLFVAEEARSKGIGTALLDAVTIEAKRRGYRQIRLDVVDTNTRAKALYRRRGFTELKTQKIGVMRHVFGFRTATAMVRDIYPEPISAPAAKTSAPPRTT